MATEVAWDFVSAITDLGAEKIKDLDVEVVEEGGGGIMPVIDSRCGVLLGTAGGLCRAWDFIFFKESLSISPSVSHCLFNGLLLLLFRSNTSLGIGLGSGEIFLGLAKSDLVEEEVTGAWGFMALPKLNTGSESTFS